MPNNNRQIDRSQLAPDQVCAVKGQLAFARVISKIAGDELAERNKHTQYPRERPYTVVTLDNPEIVQDAPGTQLTQLEAYVSERFYVSQSGAHAGTLRATFNNSGNLPVLAERQPDGSYAEAHPTADPAAGQTVTVIVRSFVGSRGAGVGFDALLFDEPIVAGVNGASAANLGKYLADRHIVFRHTEAPAIDGLDAPVDESESESVQPQAPAYQAPTAPQQPAYQAPQPQVAPQQQAPAYQAPTAPQQPAYQAPAAPQPQSFGAPAQPAAPAAQPYQQPQSFGAANPFQPAGPVQTPQGIRFDPNRQ